MEAAALVQWLPLTDLPPHYAQQDWETLRFDKSLEYTPITIGNRVFKSGLGTHAASTITYYLGGRFKRFQAFVGIDAAAYKYKTPRVSFEVLVDGKPQFSSGVMTVSDEAKLVDVDVAGGHILTLLVKAGSESRYAEHANWADAKLLPVSGRPPSVGTETVIQRGVMRAAVDLAGIQFESIKLLGGLEGATPEGPATIDRHSRTSITTRQVVRCLGAHRAEIRQTFTALPTRIECRATIEGLGGPWSAPIYTEARFPVASKLWMAAGRGYEWSDPLQPWLPQNEYFTFGKRFDKPMGVSLPLLHIVPPKGAPVAVAFSPRDVQLDAVVITKPGRVVFSRENHRIEKGRPVVLNWSVSRQHPDIRSSLGWMSSLYPEFFKPKVKIAAGLGSYSGDEEVADAAKLKKMGYNLNWKASMDFPYMGMFLPPLNPDEKWNRFAGGGAGDYTEKDEGRYGQTSMAALEAYNRRMRAKGFHVLNYFNVTEFGGNIKDDPKLAGQDWRSPNAFLHGQFPKAILRDPGVSWTWGSAVATDCGDPLYRAFLLDQLDRHLIHLPSASGICIDRMDWLNRRNPHADDGVTWKDGPARTLYTSWNTIMKEVGSRVHREKKVVFVNDLIQRLDLLKEVDGIYDEYGHVGGNLNANAFLCLYKPLLAWTPNADVLKDDPDGYFQRHLLLGAFPTAPVSKNDHTIVPTPEVEKLYLDYGPLFEALKGREWVLVPDVITAPGARTNLFKTPRGYVAVVVFAKPEAAVTVRLAQGKWDAVKAIVPGGDSRPVKQVKGGWEVKTHRGAALILLKRG